MKSDKRKKIEVKTRVEPAVAKFLEEEAESRNTTVYTLLQKLINSFYRRETK